MVTFFSVLFVLVVINIALLKFSAMEIENKEK